MTLKRLLDKLKPRDRYICPYGNYRCLYMGGDHICPNDGVCEICAEWIEERKAREWRMK